MSSVCWVFSLSALAGFLWSLQYHWLGFILMCRPDCDSLVWLLSMEPTQEKFLTPSYESTSTDYDRARPSHCRKPRTFVGLLS
jgi:hypothetical protein